MGKTAVVHALAHRIAAGEVPENLSELRLIAVSMPIWWLEQNTAAILKNAFGNCWRVVDKTAQQRCLLMKYTPLSVPFGRRRRT